MRKTLICFMLMAFTLATASYASDRAPTQKAESAYSLVPDKNAELPQIVANETIFYCFDDELGRIEESCSVKNHANSLVRSDNSTILQLKNGLRKPFRTTIRYLRSE